MNPDKLFDYLDGKLDPAAREAFETKLASDSHLLRQLAVAREIHRGMRGSRDQQEVVVPIDDPELIARSGRMGRRILTAAMALVLLNVLIGLSVIASKRSKPANTNAKEAQIRQQLAASLDAAAQNALPPPTFDAAEVHLTAPRAEWDSVAARITAAAESCGGSAAKGLPDENALMVVVDVPSQKETEFRRLIAPSREEAAVPPSSPAADSNKRTIVQVHIAAAAR